MPGDIIPFAWSEGVTLFFNGDGRFSFFNSPFYAHHHFAGVDIYPSHHVWHGADACSPVSGEVVGIKPVSHFASKFFKCSRRDYVILVRSFENPDMVIKLLHVEPSVVVGDRIKVGDKLGTYLRSGFFDSWTDPHVHAEVRNSYDAVRARGGCRIHRILPLRGDAEPMQSLVGVVVKRRQEYMLVALEESPFHGITVSVEGETAILEGGIPHYGYFGVHLEGSLKPGSQIKLCNKSIGVLKATLGNMGIAEFNGPVPRINGVKINMSLYVYASLPLLKIVPQKPRGLSFEEGEEVEITF